MNSSKYIEERSEYKFKHQSDEIRIIIDTMKDDSTVFFTITSEVKLDGERRARKRKRTGLIYKKDKRDIRVRIAYNNMPGYETYNITVDFNVDTREIQNVYREVNR